jgi:hypothetical protein
VFLAPAKIILGIVAVHYELEVSDSTLLKKLHKLLVIHC